MARTYTRDARGRFARTGRTAAAASSAGRKVGRKATSAYVKGSFQKHLEVGPGGSYKGVKVGAEFRSPKGRKVLVKGIAGYSGRPDRRLDVTPKLNKTSREFTLSVRPNPGRKALAGKKIRR